MQLEISWPLQSYARSCNTYERDKAEYFAEKAGKKIISEYGGGRDKRTNISSCEYNYFEYHYLHISLRNSKRWILWK